MPETVAIALITSISTLGGLFIGSVLQAMREREARRHAQRDATLGRIRSAYRLALSGQSRIAIVASDAGNPLLPGESLEAREVRLYSDFRAAIDLLNQAWTELNLENARVDALSLSPQLGRAYIEYRFKLQDAHPDGSPATFDEVQALSAELFSLMERQRKAIRAHLAELDDSPGHRKLH